MSLAPDVDIFTPGQGALAAAREAFAGRGFFVSGRRLQPDGSWTGPAEAGLALVEEDALPALGGLQAAKRAGANTMMGRPTSDFASALGLGMRCLVRVPFVAGQTAEVRDARLAELGEACRRFPAIDGVVPTPTGEVQGLDTLGFFAACRLALPAAHLIVDLDVFGHKLGQLCLSFGADTILGSISGQRALRLGAAASSHDLTRDEAALLLRASGFAPCERLPDGEVKPV